MSYYGPLLLAFLIALATTLLLTPVARQLALRLGFVDRPNPRRLSPLKPRLGGVAVFLGFVAALGLTAPLVDSRTADELRKLVGLLVGGFAVLLVGIVDDRFELGPLPQLVAQIFAAVVALSAGLVVDLVNSPFGGAIDLSAWPAVIVGFTLFWYLGMMNTVNFVDGLDGLAAGVTAIAAAILFLRSIFLPEGPQYSVALLPLALCGAMLGFLRYNTAPASITLGTAGSAFLGFTLASLAIVGGTKAATMLLVLGIPILDVAWIIVWRVGQGRSPFRADRGHLHYRLLGLGLSERQIVLLLYLLCASFGALGLLLPSRLLKLYALGGAAIVLAVLLIVLARRAVERPAQDVPRAR